MLASVSLLAVLWGSLSPAMADDECGEPQNGVVICDAASYADIDYAPLETLTILFSNPDTLLTGKVNLVAYSLADEVDGQIVIPQLSSVNGDIQLMAFQSDGQIMLGSVSAVGTSHTITAYTIVGDAEITLGLGDGPTVISGFGLYATTSVGPSGDARIVSTDAHQTINITGSISSSNDASGDAIIDIDFGDTTTADFGAFTATDFSQAPLHAQASGSGNASISLSNAMMTISNYSDGADVVLAETTAANASGNATISIADVTVIGDLGHPLNIRATSANGDASISITNSQGLEPGILMAGVVAEAANGTATIILGGSGTISAVGSAAGLVRAEGQLASIAVDSYEISALDDGSGMITALSTSGGSGTNASLSVSNSLVNAAADYATAIRSAGSTTVQRSAIAVEGTYSTGLQLVTRAGASGANTASIEDTTINATGAGTTAVLIDAAANSSLSLNLLGVSTQVKLADPVASGRYVASAISMLDDETFGVEGVRDITMTIDSGTTISVDTDPDLDSLPDTVEIVQYAFVNAIDAAGNTITITSEGVVIGDTMLGGGSSNVTIADGTWIGNIYGDFDSVNGSSADTLNQGTDQFTWTGGSFVGGVFGDGGDDFFDIVLTDNPEAISEASFDGGAGADTLLLEAGDYGTISGAAITAFENVIFSDVNADLQASGLMALDLRSAYADDGVLGTLILDQGTSTAFISDPDSADGAVQLGGHLTLTGGVLAQPASSQLEVLGDVRNWGTIALADGAIGGVLTIDGDYYGNDVPGGLALVSLDISRAGGNDSIVIGGDVFGTTVLSLNATGRSLRPHIYELVQLETGASASADAFALDGGGFRSRLFNYDLFYYDSIFGVFDSGYYLLPFLSTGSIEAGFDEAFLAQASMADLVSAGISLQPYVPLYEAYPSVLLDMMAIPSLETRSAGRYAHGEALSSGPAPAALWGRLGGSFSHNDPGQSTTGYDDDLSTSRMQAGLDGLFFDNAAGALVASFTGNYANGEAKVRSAYGNSKIHTDGWGLGATVTWFGENGFYADGLAEMTLFSSELKADGEIMSPGDSDATGYGLSAEVGQRFMLTDTISLTPQAQLAFTSVSIDSFTGPYGEAVSFDDGQSLLGRIGIGIETLRSWQDGSGAPRSARFYSTASLDHEFLDGTNVVVDEIYNLASVPDDWSGTLSLGGSYGWQAGNVAISVFAELSAATGFDTGSFGYGGNVGLKVRW
ncbi:autotransporter outer membrane beta-barrel domain-containing protein [Martelella sp. HB161492]|uniref:autotransporter outer membrane beta-barrel domain-containing protein n=1 Tax=Martelella sp. HB161492 TaxID=2720726 RepID=UPI001590CFFF|nr:autotransporter outer membrane beta-barrel domain-containing protein [Martelella sp. HB161492]